MMVSIGSHKAFDMAIIGGGIVGIATGRQLKLTHPNLSVCILEKESELATHQSHRNSGVVHRGIYYKPKTFKSRLCIDGSKKIFQYCAERNIPVKKCGKLVVATDSNEIDILQNLMLNVNEAGIQDVKIIGKNDILKIQPGCTAAIEALWSPNTGIVDWKQVAHSFADEFTQNGGVIIPSFEVKGMKIISQQQGKPLVEITHKQSSSLPTVRAQRVVVCAGLYSDTLAEMSCCDSYPKIVPFRGDYLVLKKELAEVVKTNLYPAPDRKLPFLGVHITPRLDGSVIVGPNAMLSLKREGYKGNFKDMDLWGDTRGLLTSIGTYRLLLRPDYIKAGWNEIYRILSRGELVKHLKKFLPQLDETSLCFTNHCGIRAQCVDRQGNLVDDFVFDISREKDWKSVLHVRNCPSPAATSSLSISEHIVDIVRDKLLL